MIEGLALLQNGQMGTKEPIESMKNIHGRSNHDQVNEKFIQVELGVFRVQLVAVSHDVPSMSRMENKT